MRSGIHSGIHWLCFIIKSISDIQHTSLLVKEKTPQRPLRHPFTPDGQNGRGVLGVYIYIYIITITLKKLNHVQTAKRSWPFAIICHLCPGVRFLQQMPSTSCAARWGSRGGVRDRTRTVKGRGEEVSFLSLPKNRDVVGRANSIGLVKMNTGIEYYLYIV